MKLSPNIRGFVLSVLIFITINCGFSTATPAQHFVPVKKAEVVVLSTLHQFHEQSKYYSFAMLSELIERLRPDVLAVELTPADLASRREQKVKQEYQRSVFPLVDKHGYVLVPLEPVEPKFSELVQLVRESEKELAEKSPQKDEAFNLYVETLYDDLFKKWDSPLAVNSAETDALFEVKHEFQNALYGEKQRQGWEGWNQYFLEQIVQAAEKYRGKRIVVLVGAEHAYWLRRMLRVEKAVNLRSLESVLKNRRDSIRAHAIARH